MIESYLEEGTQKIHDHMTYGKSITDPCLGWEDTEQADLQNCRRVLKDPLYLSPLQFKSQDRYHIW